MPRWFNTAGPCNPADHYMIPPDDRLPQVRRLIDHKAYFVLHASRQTGKTTSFLTLARQLTKEGAYVAVLLSAEAGIAFANDVGAAELALLEAWRGTVSWQLPANLQPPPFPEGPPGQRIAAALQAWSYAAPRPLTVFLDEIDALQNSSLISVLRQLRAGYPGRPRAFPQSLALIGLRDVRNSKVAPHGNEQLGTTSFFNITVESLTLRSFTRDEVSALYVQHTADTGQVFLPDAIDRAFDLTQGQPWLVNALARQLVEVLVTDRSLPITRAAVDRAKEIFIDRRDTHLDSPASELAVTPGGREAIVIRA